MTHFFVGAVCRELVEPCRGGLEEVDACKVWAGLEEVDACKVWAGLRCAEDMLSDEMAVPVAMRTNSFSLDSAQRHTAIHCLELTDSLR